MEEPREDQLTGALNTKNAQNCIWKALNKNENGLKLVCGNFRK